MRTLRELLKDAERIKTAIGHFNISDMVTLRAVFSAAQELKVPVLIGTAEGEREFIGPHQAVAVVRSLREEFDFPIFLNADHTHSLERVKEAVAAGYDSITFDASKLDFKENVRLTKEVVEYIRAANPDVLVEGEIGFIGSSSEVFKEIPEGAAVREKDFTTPEQAREFVSKTGVDLLAPAIGNLHGLFANAEKLNLDVERARAVRNAAGVPLVLHGGSGIPKAKINAAIRAGVSIVHINTELRVAWRRGIEKGLADNPDEIAPYKLYASAIEEIKRVASDKLRTFNFY